MLKVGSAQADITPAQPMLMGGSFKKFQSESVLDPLMASCVVADDGRERVAIVGCDLGTLPRDLVVEIRGKVSSATGTPPEHIHLTVTHNHSGPTIRDVPFADTDGTAQAQRDAMRSKLVADIAGCAIEAHERLVPARMSHGRGWYEGGAYNRRFIMSNGRSRMHGGGNLERLRAEGPEDREVQAVWFENTEGRPLAVMVNYSTHTTNLYGRPTVSADFPGAMRDVLQHALGDDVPILYLQGACGNVMCADVRNPNCPRGSMENVVRLGRALAGETLRIMGDTFDRTDDVPITSCSQTLVLPFRDVPPLPPEQAEEQWTYYKAHWDEFLALDIEQRAMLNSTLRLMAYKQDGPAEEAEISAFALGDVYVVTNPAELFVEYQLDVKRRFAGHKVIMSELTNGWIGYVPTKVACALGGYETIQTRFNPGAGDLIRDASCELLDKLIARTAVQPHPARPPITCGG